MDQKPRLLVWNFTPEEKQKLDAMLDLVKAPPAFRIMPEQGHLLVREIVQGVHRDSAPFVCDEKIVLFYNIPQKGIFFLIQKFKDAGLPKPIFAVVTEHSINWPFSELAAHLIEERRQARERSTQEPKGEPPA